MGAVLTAILAVILPTKAGFAIPEAVKFGALTHDDWPLRPEDWLSQQRQPMLPAMMAILDGHGAAVSDSDGEFADDDSEFDLVDSDSEGLQG